MENLEHLGNHIVLGSPTEKLITNAIVDATDTTVTSTAVSPNIRTATLRDDYITENWRSTDLTLTLTAQFKWAFGVFLSNNLGEDTPRMYCCKGTFNVIVNEANQFTRVIPIFGRLSSKTPVQSDAVVSNTLANYIVLPTRSNIYGGLNSATAGNLFSLSVDETVVIRDSAISDGYPVFFGFVIENCATAVDTNLDYINSTIMLRTNIGHPIATFTGV